MIFPAARVGDPVTHDLTVPSGVIGPPLTPPTGGLVMIEGLLAAHVECTIVCSGATSAGMAHPPPGAGAPPVPVILGSPTVWINGKPAARWAPSGDMGACSTQLGDPKLAAVRTVLIGGPGLPEGMSMRVTESGEVLFGTAISIVGTDQFKAAVLDRLLRIGDTSSGRTLFKQLENSGKQATIKEYTEQNSYAAPADWVAASPAGKPIFDGSGAPVKDASGKQYTGTGLGSDSEILLNPNLTLERIS